VSTNDFDKEEPGSALERGRAFYERRAWAHAYRALAQADQAEPLRPAELELFAWSAGLSGRVDDFLRLLERLYQIHLEKKEHGRAARAAFWLGLRLSALGEQGRGGGWLARGERLAQAEDCVEQGYLRAAAATRALAAGDIEAAQAAAASAASIAERFREADLVALARSIEGRVLLRRGTLDRGLALLDETMVAATSGELSPVMTGLVYCSVIASYQAVYALDRAREWTVALADWCDAQPELVSFNGTCRVHRAEIMQIGGAWAEAIEEARQGTERCSQAVDPDGMARALYQEAEIHRLRGELGEAEDGYRRAHQAGREPQPGLALLRLAQGRAAAAGQALRRELGATTDRLRRIALLPSYVEIMLAEGDLEEARTASGELSEIADVYRTDVFQAVAAQAEGAVELAAGNARGALDPLRRAFHVWQQVGAPYFAARLRVLLARACHALGDADGSKLELEMARDAFARLGAAPDVAAIDALAKGRAPLQRHGLTQRELEVLRLVAAGKTNKVVAKELCLSEKTIDRHVSNIFIKLKVSSRAAATAFAYERKLL
jgi:DNA-binding CsgD family transcriptional regulator